MNNFINLKKYVGKLDDSLYIKLDGNRGLFSNSDINEYTPIIKINQDKIIQSDNLPFYNQFKELTRTDNSIIAMYLCILTLNKDKSIKPFLDILPSLLDFTNYPYFLDPEEFKFLKLTKIDFECQKNVELTINEYNIFLKHRKSLIPFIKKEGKFPNFYLYFYYRLIVNSRVFSYIRDSIIKIGLVPYADMINHSNNPNCNWIFNESNQTFDIISNKKIPANHEITLNYGCKPNNILYQCYGFTIPNNVQLINIPYIKDWNKKDLKTMFIYYLNNYDKIKDNNIKNIYSNLISEMLYVFPNFQKYMKYFE
jgi:hypothetical protein